MESLHNVGLWSLVLLSPTNFSLSIGDQRNGLFISVFVDLPHDKLKFVGQMIHSYLSAAIGSTLAARLAGIQHANNDTTSKTNGTAANVNGSVAATPKSNVLINLVSANDATTPNTTPINVNPIPFRITNHSIFTGVA